MLSTVLTALLSLTILQSAPSVIWKAAVNHIQDDSYQLVVTGKVAPDYYVHPMSDPYVGTTLAVDPSDGVFIAGQPVEEFAPQDYKGETVVTGNYVLKQDLQITGTGKVNVTGTVTWSACSGDYCQMPEDYDFNVQLKIPGQARNDEIGTKNDEKGGSKSLWALILEAILWGFLMLLTPCVFPMVPMTVSFFLKQSDTPAKGRFNALMYGIFIVLLYTVPICIIIGLTWALGGATVTADIFNWLATH